MAETYDRFRSFAERYLVARADRFERGKELEQGWQCIMDAKKLYHMMEHASHEMEPPATQAGVAPTSRFPPNPPTLPNPSVQLAHALDIYKDMVAGGKSPPHGLVEHVKNLTGLLHIPQGAPNAPTQSSTNADSKARPLR